MVNRFCESSVLESSQKRVLQMYGLGCWTKKKKKKTTYVRSEHKTQLF